MPTARVKYSHFSDIHSLWNFSANVLSGMPVSHSGINMVIVIWFLVFVLSFSLPYPLPGCLFFLSFSIYLCGGYAVRILIFKDSLCLCYRSRGWALPLLRHRGVWIWRALMGVNCHRVQGIPRDALLTPSRSLCLPFHLEWKSPSWLLILEISPLDQSALMGKQGLNTQSSMSPSTPD